MAARHAGAQALSSGRTAAGARHAGGGPGLVDEHEPLGVEFELTLEPSFAPAQDVRTVLLGRVRRLLWDGPPPSAASA
jgi:hypothetical protein